ncbi:Transcriptional regulator, contains XRE-family HTH domain [Lacrimispora sphenoides]|uniref:helix-turn-helix domain-containing protein n=1 Tax=Lacrimispora sphenoides TaxID=29370 RepID=UPI0008BF8107|nr:helix-turn-helix transcriptional regulator [Lacrimispora sphenoides]SET79344.1 Transcriptional regulator, contains XRE-family HTH domain [Lacrimispora sphenoides]
MYEIFEQLLQKCGVTAYKVSKETGVTQSTLSDWKRGRSTPKTDNMKKIADYFGVTVDYLMTGEEAKDITPEASRIETLAAHFEGEEITDEEMEEIMNYVRFVKSRRKK